MARPHIAPRALTIWIAALVLCLLVYAAIAKPGPWYSPASELRIAPSSMRLTRGEGVLAGGTLVISRPGQDGNAIVSLPVAFAARDYARIAWRVHGIAPGVSAALLWNTDVEPGRVNRAALAASSGALLPVDVSANPHWLGHVRGLALVLHGELKSPVTVLGVDAGSGDALQTLGARLREWLGYGGWSGTSINTLPGGTDDQRLPLPLLLAVSIAVAAGALGALAWRRARAGEASDARAGAPEVMLIALVCWFLLDARWQATLVRHVHDDGFRFAGKTSSEKHLALEDGALFAFTEKARTVLPPLDPAAFDAAEAGAPVTGGDAAVPGNSRSVLPARVFILADSDYLRGRAAYHMYPWNVWSDAVHNVVPPANQLHRGDWIVVYQRRGVEYDAATHHLRWDGNRVLDADLKLLDHGGALFEVR